MSTVRIQVRRGTASQWASINPILAAGEMGLESDTNFIKFGDGVHAWSDLGYANEPLSNLQNTLADYVQLSDMGQPNGVATLNSSGKIPSTQLDSSAFTELAQDAVSNALNVGTGLTKVYDDAGNTLTISPNTDVLASKDYTNTTYVAKSVIGQANGVASLNSDSKIPNNQIDETVWAQKFQIDAAISGITIKPAVRATSTANFPAVRTAGTADASGGYGVGERLTASSNGVLVVDGVTLAVDDRVLLKDQTDGKQNGIYVVTNAGGSSSKAILTRATDSDNSVNGEVRSGDFAFTIEGTDNQRDGYVLLSGASRSGGIFQLGTDSLTYSQFTGAIPVQVSTGLKKTGDVVLVDFDVAATKASVDSLATTEANARTAIGTRIDGALSRLDTHDTTLTSVNNRLTTDEASISSLNTTVAAHTSTIASHTTQLSTINTTNASQDSSISSLGSRLTTAEANITTQAGNITDVTTSVSTLNTTLRNDLAPKTGATFTGTITLPQTTSIGTTTSTELGYVHGVTSAIQTQIDTKLASNTAASTYATIASDNLKAPLANPTFTGTVTLPTGTVTSTMILDGTIVNADINATAAIAATKIAGTAVTQADTGTVTSAMIADGTIVAGDLADGSVTSAKILDGTIVNGNISATAAIAATKIAGTAITAADTGTVTSTMIADGTILDADINASAAIAQSKISGLTTALAAKAPLASPTFTGTVTTGDMTVSGNLTVSGTTTTVSANNLVVDDSLIYLADNNTSSDALEIGFFGAYKGSGDSSHKHTGFVRDHADGKWKLVYNLTEPTSNNIDFTSASYGVLKAGTFEGNLTGNVTGALTGNADTVTNGVYLTATQTLTNKTLTAPSISNANMSGTTTYASGGAIQFSDGTQQSTAGVASLTTIGTQISANTNLSSVGLSARDQMIPVAGTVNITIPANATTAYPVGTSIDFYQASGSNAAFVADSGVTFINTPGLKMRATGSVATAMKVATNTWLIFGDLSA